MGGKPSTSTPADMRLKANRPANLSQDARQAAADRGEAMPDGSYPIRNKSDLARAVLAIGRASDPQAVKRFITKRARALDAINLLPKSWNITA